MPRSWPAWSSPVTGQPLELVGDALVSSAGDRFPVVRGIPRFVADDHYAEAFGAQWNKFRLTQLDSHSGLTLTRDRTRRCVGEEIWSHLAESQLLECGCGAGRFTEILLGQGAHVTSVDLSSAVDANATNFPPSDRHRVAQADIRHLPFAPGQYDVVFCLGVVQHTPNPEETIAALYEQVRPGGHLVIDHYAHPGNQVKLALRRWLMRRPPGRALPVIRRLVDVFLPIHRALRNTNLPARALDRLSPIAAYYRTLPALSEQQQREWAILDTHDTLTDWYKHVRSREQIRQSLVNLGAEDVWCEHGGNGVEARARKPVTAPVPRSGAGRRPDTATAGSPGR